MDALCEFEDWIREDPLAPDESAMILDPGLVDCAENLVRVHETGAPPPAGARLPADKVRFFGTMTAPDGSFWPLGFRCQRDMTRFLGAVDKPSVSVYAYEGATKSYTRVGSFSHESRELALDTTYRKQEKEMVYTLMLVAYILDLVNTPSFVIQSPLPRRARRRMSKAYGKNASDNMRIISWNVTAPKLRSGESLGSGRHMPLHYTRGHWRKCAKHLERAHEHPDGEHRMWIEGFWSGHPAYGVVRSVYAPKI